MTLYHIAVADPPEMGVWDAVALSISNARIIIAGAAVGSYVWQASGSLTACIEQFKYPEEDVGRFEQAYLWLI